MVQHPGAGCQTQLRDDGTAPRSGSPDLQFSHEVIGSGATPISSRCPSGESGTPPGCRTSPAPLPGGRRPKKPPATSGYCLATLRVDCLRVSKLLRMVGTRFTASPCLQSARDAVGCVPIRFRAAKRVRMSGGSLPNPNILSSPYYRCTSSVTHTGSPLFAMGYALSAVLAPRRVANSRGLKPLRTAYRGPPRVFAPGILNRLTRSDGCRGSLSLSPGGGERPRRRRAPGAEFALVNDHLLLFAIGRERTRAFSILVLSSGLTRLLATT